MPDCVPDTDAPLEAVEIMAGHVVRRLVGQILVEILTGPHPFARGDRAAQQAETEPRRRTVCANHIHQEDVGPQADGQVDRIDLGAPGQAVQALREMVTISSSSAHLRSALPRSIAPQQDRAQETTIEPTQSSPKPY
jgi:hypothetical protein